MDTISVNKINSAHPKERDNMQNAYAAIVKATPVGVHPVVDEVYRSFAESDALYQEGRDANGHVVNQDAVVSNAPGGTSWHNYGLALDIHMNRNGQEVWFDTTPAGADKAAADPDYAVIIKVMAGFGYNWGGNFPNSFRDVPHFENKRGQTINGLLTLHNEGKFIPGTTYVNF